MTLFTFLMIIVAIVAFFWIFGIAFMVTHVFIPYAWARFDERHWLKLHPGMPLHRRPVH